MQLKVGDIVEGKITGITNFGVFADIGKGVSGMVHISEISSTYVKDINEFLKVGDTAKMQVLSISEGGKISLSIKNAGEAKPQVKKEKKQKMPIKASEPDKSFVWEAKTSEPASFEEMMSRFKKKSDEKISDLKRKSPEARRVKRSSGGR
ncbi:MAG: S1 RNA-binding domain-containing protein [Clostridia bacterium]|nr:S1 RNA-binding domain-containing protein [Clostridia bacterium]